MKIIYLALICLCTVPLLAADRFVGTNVPGASDTNDGLSATLSGGHGPWKTVSKAFWSATAGDTVYILAGTYNEPWPQVGNSGTAAAPIVFTADPANRPILRVTELKVEGRQWITISNLILIGPTPRPAAWVDMPAIVIDNPGIGALDPRETWGTRAAKVGSKFATYTALKDSLAASSSAGVHITNSSNVTVSGNDVSWFANGIKLSEEAHDVTVTNNDAHHNLIGIDCYATAVNAIGARDCLISANRCFQNINMGMDFYRNATRLVISGNSCNLNAIHHISLDLGATACTVRSNYCRDAGYYSEAMDLPGSSAINCLTVGPGNVVESDWCEGQLDVTYTDGNGIILDTSTSSVVVRNNVCIRNQGSGITSTHTTGNTIVNNTCVENGLGIGSAFWGESNGFGIRAGQLADVQQIIVGNIMAGNTRGGLCLAYTTGTTVDHNLYHLTSGVVAKLGNTEFASVVQLRSNSSFEANGIQGDPLFVNAGASQLSVRSGSPAISMASSSWAPALDFNGKVRDALPDAGAYEYTGPTITLNVASTGTAGNVLTLTATATAIDSSIAKVEFFIGGILLSSDTSAPFAATWTPTAAGGYQVTAKVTDQLGASALSVTTVTITVASGETGSGTGLTGIYCANMQLTNATITRTDAVVDFDWGSGSPVSGLGSDGFSVRWTGQVQAQFSETYTFSTLSDDGVRLWVNGQQLITNWTDHGPTENSGTIALIAGQKYDLTMEFYENGGGAVAKLSWASASTAQRIIPTSQLYPGAAPVVGLPVGWSSQDIGTVGIAGSTSHSNGTWTVAGCGTDIWNSADSFQFASRPITGDVMITAHVTSLTNTDTWAKAGVMIREAQTPGARHAMTVVTPGSGLAYQRRLTTGGPSSHTAGPYTTAPYWVRLERRGDLFISSVASNGSTWIEIRRETIALNAAVYVGLAVTSHNNGQLCTAVFANVQVVGIAATAN